MTVRFHKLALGLALLAGACTPHGDDLNDDDLQLKTDWNDLMTQVDEGGFEPVAALPLSLDLTQPALYEGGIFGLNGVSKVFVAPTSKIKDYARLYWVMVKVLSEKYSCFMTAKQNIGDKTLVNCRDGRKVVFWRTRNSDWIQFHARQYDAAGYEIMVKQHKVIRVSKERML